MIYMLSALREVESMRDGWPLQKADNLGAPEDEGLSYIVTGKGANLRRVLLRDAINEVCEEIIGRHTMRNMEDGLF